MTSPDGETNQWGTLFKGDTIFHLHISSYGETDQGGKLIRGGLVMYADVMCLFAIYIKNNALVLF